MLSFDYQTGSIRLLQISRDFVVKILILSQIFETPSDTGSERHFFFAKHLVNKGHTVHVVTANIDYKNAVPRFPEHTKTFEAYASGIKISYVPVFCKFRGSFFKRFLFFISFIFGAFIATRRVSKFDAVYAISTPLTVGILGVFISKISRVPLIFEVTDLWPQAAIETGVIRNRLIIFVARIAERICYKFSARIICLTEGIRDAIVRYGVPTERTSLITNGIDVDLFPDQENAKAVWVSDRDELLGKFVVMYMGAHGAYNALGTIMNAALLLKDEGGIKFVLIGAGDEKEKLVNFASSHQLSNVVFLGTVERRRAAEFLAAADVFLLPNRRGSFYEGNLPNKLFDYLASARPVIVAGQGESAKLVLDAGAGIVVKAEDALELSQAILEIRRLPEERRKLIGQNGRRHVMRYFDRMSHADLLEELITSAV